MNDSWVTVARRYAQAYLDLSMGSLTLDHIERMQHLEDFLRTHTSVLFLCSMPIMKKKAQHDALAALLGKYDLAVVQPIFILLLTHKRLFLVPELLRQMRRIYYSKRSMQLFTFISSSPLTLEQNSLLQNFLARLTGSTIIYTNKVDKKLRAGVRLVSETLLWEHSISRQIRSLELPLIR
jgi:F-type H+-transporting ATPase subunit delta